MGQAGRAAGPDQLDTVPSPTQRLASRVSGRAMPRAKKMSHCNEETRAQDSTAQGRSTWQLMPLHGRHDYT